MLQKIIDFFMAIIAFFMSLFGGITSPQVEVLKNVSYGTDSAQVMDIYLPVKHDSITKPIGVIIGIHGGSWEGGDKSSYDGLCKNIAQSNYQLASASINYRLTPSGATYNDMMDDITAAINQIIATLSENNLTVDRCAIFGSSAGAHLTLLYSYAKADVSPLKICFALSQCGPVDLTDANFYAGGANDWRYPVISKLLGRTITSANANDNIAYLQEASPITYVSSASVPTIIAHGNADDVVPYSNAVSLDAKLTQLGVAHDFITFNNTGHALDNDQTAADLQYAKFISYIETYLVK